MMTGPDTDRTTPPEPHPAWLSDTALLGACNVRRQRRSGPGGQHRNKVETGVVLVHRPTGIRAEATERRNQAENQRVALTRLRVKLALELRQPRGLNAPPSAQWRRRTVSGRIAVNPHHEQFPGLLAEALDVLQVANYDVRQAATLLGVTSSQLVRFLKLEPRALHQVNQRRSAIGLRPLR